MDQRLSTLAEVLTFAPQQEPQGESNPADHAGHALIARLREAANISNQNVERAMTLAHKLSVQLRAAEDRIAELQDEIGCLKTRATAAEQWLETIKHEIEDKLISQLQANRAH